MRSVRRSTRHTVRDMLKAHRTGSGKQVSFLKRLSKIAHGNLHFTDVVSSTTSSGSNRGHSHHHGSGHGHRHSVRSIQSGSTQVSCNVDYMNSTEQVVTPLS